MDTNAAARALIILGVLGLALDVVGWFCLWVYWIRLAPRHRHRR